MSLRVAGPKCIKGNQLSQSAIVALLISMTIPSEIPIYLGPRKSRRRE
uniref:Uncharacterized protein n=1 Tax=Agrobacterium tumefaciens TaxID=358 RepID=K7WT26_AGRTU|nr:Hypothetical protein [Agrobacterium radiobacter]